MNTNSGWIKIHRNILDWEWWTEPLTAHLFIHCILKANHTNKQWKGQTIERGSFISSVANLCAETGLTTQQLRTSLKRLISSNELTSKTTNKNTKITICNFDIYQSEEEESNKQNNKQITNEQQTNNKQITNEQQTNNKQITTTKNNKNDENERNIPPYNPPKGESGGRSRFVKPTLEEVTAYCQERGNGIDPQDFIDYYDSCGWMVGKKPMKDWKAAMRTWESKRKQSSPQPSSDNERQNSNGFRIPSDIERAKAAFNF